MSEAYVGEIRMFAGNYAPEGWLPCDGSAQSINTYQALYSLLGTTYGGDGVNNFKLPDLRGRLPIGMGQGTGLTARPLGQQTGTETVTLTVAQTPAHSHGFAAGGTASAASPQGLVPGTTSGFNLYATSATAGAWLAPGSVTPSDGGAQPHNNVMPSLAISFIICTQGYYPSQA